MATEREHPSAGIHPDAYNAALRPGTKIQTVFRDRSESELEAALNSVTPGSKNTLLHLAASVGNIACIEELLQLNPPLVKATNVEGSTALHLAAHRGFSEAVGIILGRHQTGEVVSNKLGETALFKACESGDIDTVKNLLTAFPSSLWQRTVDGRTCLSVAINRGDSDLVNHILNLNDAKQRIRETYKHGDTVLHIAVVRNYVHIITQLIEFEPKLCYCLNDNQETPLCMAVNLGHLEAVKELIKWRPDAVDIPNSWGMNVLHLAAQISQVRIVDYLNKTVDLSYLANQGINKPSRTNNDQAEETDPSSETEPRESRENTDQAGETDPSSETEPRESAENTDQAKRKDPPLICQGDTPLHIAARSKHFHMVDSLLRIQGINNHAVNKDGLTAFDIARENTEYHESHKIIATLGNYPSKRRPFMYSAPKMTAEKRKVAIDMVDKTFDGRRNTELVVAVLLATMAFTAAFTVPGGFQTEIDKVKTRKMLGSPVLIGIDSFKLFLVFDYVAFFLSLFVLLMWQMSTPLTTGDKILFLCITNFFLCTTLAFTAYSFMAAVYTMLAHKVKALAWSVLGVCTVIGCCGNLAFSYLLFKFIVKNARFNNLTGVLPLFPDRVAEYVWLKLESWGLLDLLDWCKGNVVAILQCNCLRKARAKPNRAAENKCGSILHCNWGFLDLLDWRESNCVAILQCNCLRKAGAKPNRAAGNKCGSILHRNRSKKVMAIGSAENI